MKVTFCLICLFCWNLVKGQLPNDPDAIIGRWETIKKNLIVDVYKAGAVYKARVVWFKNTHESTKPSDTWRDEKNSNSSLRNRKILGMDVMDNLIYNEKTNRWEKGDIYDSITGKTWSSSAWFTETGLLKVRGFWGVEFIGQTLIFKKI